MIRGLAGLNLATVIAGARTPGRPARGLQPLPGMDTLHLSRQGMNLAATPGATVAASVRPSGAIQTYQSLQTVGAAGAAPDEPSMADRMRASMFAAKGDKGFDAKLDLDGNGRINFADLRRFLNGDDSGPIRPADPAPAQSRQERMRASFFSTKHDGNFDPSADLNGDGRVNFADAAILRNGGATQTRPAEPALADMATRMRAAFLATKLDAGFDSALDLNNDGRINFADLQSLRDKTLGGDSNRPVRPAEPVTGSQPASEFGSAAPVDVQGQAPVK